MVIRRALKNSEIYCFSRDLFWALAFVAMLAAVRELIFWF